MPLQTLVRNDCLNFDVSLFIKPKKQIQFEEEGIAIMFLWTLDPGAVEDCKKFVSITSVLLQLVRDVISGVCYQ